MYETILPQAREHTCWNGKKVPVKHFGIAAISIRIVYNKEGDHDPNGLIYVLKENENDIKNAVDENPFTPVNLIQPLVIRANLGDFIIIVDFENKLARRASIHIYQIRILFSPIHLVFQSCLH